MPKNYEEFMKTANEMGLEAHTLHNQDLSSSVSGIYRQHYTKICHYERYLGDETSSRSFVYGLTRYEVEFENQTKLVMLITKKSLRDFFNWFSKHDKSLQDIPIGNLTSRGLQVKSNNETMIKAILDASTCNQIASFKQTLSMMEIGHIVNYEDIINRSFLFYSPPAHIQYNLACFIDSRSLAKTKENTKFRLIVDTLIDIVEKIEAYTPPV